MKKALLTGLSSIMISWFTFAQPADNPISTFYNSSALKGEGYPQWINEVRWNNVINMASFSNGANDFEKFENARDQLYSQGGGVLYYPAGVYDFKDHPTGPSGRGLMLKKGVVIRGEAPTENKMAVKDRNNVADDSGLESLKTVFVFPTWDKKANPVNEIQVVAGNGLVPRSWNHVGLMPVAPQTVKDVNLVGICWVKFRFATVYFGGDMPWGATYATAGSWQSANAKTNNAHNENWASRVPDGTHPFDPFTGAPVNQPYIPGAEKRFVFGCRFENAVVHDDIWKKGGYSSTTTDSLNMGFFGSRFSGRVVVDGAHVFVANNIIPKPTECFMYNMRHPVMLPENQGCQGSCQTRNLIRTLQYDYARSIGYDINKSMYSQRSNRCLLTGPDKSPYYCDDVVVQDNYTFQHGNKAYEVAGKWAVVRRNVRYGVPLIAYNHSYPSVAVSDDIYGLGTSVNSNRGWFNSLNGSRDCKITDDNMSRGFDMAGWNVWTTGNHYEGTGSNPGVDGEGILYQNLGSVDVFSVVETFNKGINNGGSGKGYISPYDVNVIGMLQGWNTVNSMYGSYCKDGNQHEDFSIIGNSGTYRSCNNASMADVMIDADCQGAAAPVPPSQVSVNYIPEKKCNLISWTDASNEPMQEVGFKIQRKLPGDTGWTTIAWRPRNATGGISGPGNPNNWTFSSSDRGGGAITETRCANQILDLNTQTWEDYLLGDQPTYFYRVIAPGCNPIDTTADTIIVSSKAPVSLNEEIGLLAYPNPTMDKLNVRLENKYMGNCNFSVLQIDGKEVMQLSATKKADVLNKTIPVAALKPGIYLLKVNLGSFEKTVRFIR